MMIAANGFALQPAVASAFCELTGGLPGGASQVRITPAKFYHRVNVPNTGPVQLKFFNVARSKGVCNLDQSNTIPANYAFALRHLRFHFQYGIDQLGSRATVFAGGAVIGQTTLSRGGAGAVITDTLIDNVWKAHECIRQLLESGTVTFSIANRLVCEIASLTSFPDGRGINAVIHTDQAMTAAAASNEIAHAITHISNGAPILANAFTFHPAFPIPAGQTFDLTCDWNTQVSFQDATIGPLVGATAGNPCGTLTAELEGLLVGPGSN